MAEDFSRVTISRLIEMIGDDLVPAIRAYIDERDAELAERIHNLETRQSPMIFTVGPDGAVNHQPSKTRKKLKTHRDEDGNLIAEIIEHMEG